MSELPDKKHLMWQCRRGLLELDYIFQDFLEQYFDDLPERQKQAFVELLNCADQDLQHWILYDAQPPTEELAGIVSVIQQTHKQ